MKINQSRIILFVALAWLAWVVSYAVGGPPPDEAAASLQATDRRSTELSIPEHPHDELEEEIRDELEDEIDWDSPGMLGIYGMVIVTLLAPVFVPWALKRLGCEKRETKK